MAAKAQIVWILSIAVVCYTIPGAGRSVELDWLIDRAPHG